MSTTEEAELKGGHPPAVKAGGMRITQHKSPKEDKESKAPKEKEKEQVDEGNSTLKVSTRMASITLPDFPTGPLDSYRKLATFNWKKLRIAVEDKELLAFKMKLWKKMEEDPLFHQSPITPSLDEQRRLTSERCMKIREWNLLPFEDLVRHPVKMSILILTLSQYDIALCLKYFVPYVFFMNSLRDLGTEKHTHFLVDAENDKISGCYALTEVAHGTDARNMRTTAIFDPNTHEFVINSADFEAAKCWIGNLAKTATHATLFAQLIMPDGTNHGLHAFVVPLRDPHTMKLYPGIIIGDMGEKVGLNGLDNGYAIFKNYRIPRDNLLDKMGGVTPEGTYESPFTDPRKRFGASLATLLTGRVGVTGIGAHVLARAVVIAVRYSGVRKQFGPEDNKELPIIEYQLQQWRLFPYLAASYALKIFTNSSANSLVDFASGMWFGTDLEKMMAIGLEIHALQSSAKGLSSWTAQQGIQECREACGGHGYLKCSGLGDLRNSNDANCTYEGDNNVLCQQTSNWLLQLWKHRHNKNRQFASPLGSVTFLYKAHESNMKLNKFTARTVSDVTNVEEIIAAYNWLLIWLLERTSEVYEAKCKEGMDRFTARNNSQVFYARTLSFAFIERFVIHTFWDFCNSGAVIDAERTILCTLCSLYGLWSLEKHLATLYEGGYAEGPLPSQLIRQGILHLCLHLKPNAVALADALSPPDLILNSAIGKSDGQLYKNLQAALICKL